MAKKEKTPLTPEQAEIKAIKKKRRGERTTKFFAILLALVITVGVVTAGKSVADKNAEKATSNVNADSNSNSSSNNTSDEVDFGDDGDTANSNSNDGNTDNSSTNNNSTSDNSSTNGNTATADTSKADAVKLLNDVTAKAAKGNYNWKRSCQYTTPIDVGSATSALNTVIKTVDENADLNSVVGGFIGIGDKDAKVTGGKAPEGMSENYLLKGMNLTEGDIKQFKKSGNVYMFQINACSNPQKDGSNALHHATNDFITHSEVDQGIKDGLGSAGALITLESTNVEYKSIVIKATIENDKLTNMELSYSFDAALTLKIKFPPLTVNGTGAAKTVATYSNFVY